MKICSKCNIEKEFIDFTKDKSKKDGLKTNCIECCKILYNEYKEKNLDREKERFKSYNKEKRIIDKVKIKEYKKQYFIDNKDEIMAKRRVNYSINKDSINKKRSENIPKRINNAIGSLIRYYLNKSGFYKKSRTYEILGCSPDDFKKYLESKFEYWMSWSNYGLYNGELNYGWDIDHIVPISSAKTEEEILKLNHFSNLQPLCSYTNRYVKINKIIFLDK